MEIAEMTIKSLLEWVVDSWPLSLPMEGGSWESQDNKIENQNPRKLSLPGKSCWLENDRPNRIVIII